MTPSKIKAMALEDVRKICYDYTVTGLETLSSLKRGGQKPLRFVYVSGAKAERDQSKKPWILGDYTIMRVCCHFVNPYMFFLLRETKDKELSCNIGRMRNQSLGFC